MRAAGRGALVLLAGATATAAVACSTILDIGDRTLDPGVDGSGSSSGSSSGQTTNPPDGDSSKGPDASMEAGPGPADSAMEGAPPGDTGVDARVDSGTVQPGADASESGSTACADVTADPHNCGRCGHDCLGGACVASACQPFGLVPTTAGVQPFSMTQDAQFLYWTDVLASTVYKTDKVTGTTTILWQGLNFPQPITADDASVYWGNFDGVWRCPKTGCSLNPTFVSPTPNYALGIAVDDRNIYWCDQPTTGGSVFVVPKNAVDAGHVSLWSSSSVTPAHVVTDGQKVYFTASDGLLHVMGVDGGAPGAIGSSDPSGSLGIALQGGIVFWTVLNPGQGTVWGASTSTLTASPIVVQQYLPGSVASDGVNIYWMNFGTSNNGVLRSCAIGNCTNPATLATPVRQPRAVVVDDTAIYFTDEGNASPPIGAIYRIAR